MRGSEGFYLRDIEKPFIDIFLEYYNSIDDPDAYLFNITRQRAYQLLEKLGIFPHLLRHARMTHLVVDYKFDIADMMKITGWKRAQTAMTYTHLNVTNLVEKMQKA